MSACNVLSLPVEVLVLVFEALVFPIRWCDDPTMCEYSALVTRLDAVRLTCRVFNAVVTAHFASLLDRRRAALRACRTLCINPPVVIVSDFVRLVFLGVRYHRLTEEEKSEMGSHRAHRDKNILDLLTNYQNMYHPLTVERKVANVTAAVDLLLSGTTDVVLPPRIRGYLRGTVPPAARDQLRRLVPNEFC